MVPGSTPTYPLAEAQFERGDFQGAIASADEALSGIDGAAAASELVRWSLLKADALRTLGRSRDALAILDSLGPPAESVLGAAMKMHQGYFLCMRDDFQQAASLLAEAHRIASGEGPSRVLAEIETRLGGLCDRLKRHQESESWHRRALQTALGLGNRYLECLALGGIAIARMYQGHTAEATASFRSAVSACDAIGARYLAAVMRLELAWALFAAEGYDEAEVHLATAERLFREMGTRQLHQVALKDLGNIRYQRGELGPALSLYEQALRIAEEIGDRYTISRVKHNMALVHADRGDTARAEAEAAEAHEIQLDLQRTRDQTRTPTP